MSKITSISDDYPRLVAVADSALLVEFGNAINNHLNDKVLELGRTISVARINGVLETVPSYRSLLIHYNLLLISFSSLKAKVLQLIEALPARNSTMDIWNVPVCYGGEHGKDLESVARTHQLTTEEVIRLHSQERYRVFMIGFAPGYCYLGGLNPQLHTPRLSSPRLKIPAGSIIIGGQQTAIGTLETPCGWHLLGQTPIRAYDPNRESPFFIAAGDNVKFYKVSSCEYKRMQLAAENGEVVAEKEH